VAHPRFSTSSSHHRGCPILRLLLAKGGRARESTSLGPGPPATLSVDWNDHWDRGHLAAAFDRLFAIAERHFGPSGRPPAQNPTRLQWQTNCGLQTPTKIQFRQSIKKRIPLRKHRVVGPSEHEVKYSKMDLPPACFSGALPRELRFCVLPQTREFLARDFGLFLFVSWSLS